jgi:hypothetical protein
MKTGSKLLALVGIAAFFCGCVVVSLNPLFTEDELVSYSDVIGTWKHEKETWTFEAGPKKAYKLTHEDEKKRKATFTASMGKLGTNLLMDIVVEDIEGDVLNNLASVQLIPGHVMLKVSKRGADLSLLALDLEWIRDELKKDPKITPHVLQGDRPILTGSTEELQKFALKYINHTNAFKNEILLHRKS